jgi:hypothetical protein
MAMKTPYYFNYALKSLALIATASVPFLFHASVQADPVLQIQYYCASRSVNAYQYNTCRNIMYQRLQQQSGGGGYFDPDRKTFHPCDNPLVPTSLC